MQPKSKHAKKNLKLISFFLVLGGIGTKAIRGFGFIIYIGLCFIKVGFIFNLFILFFFFFVLEGVFFGLRGAGCRGGGLFVFSPRV